MTLPLRVNAKNACVAQGCSADTIALLRVTENQHARAPHDLQELARASMNIDRNERTSELKQQVVELEQRLRSRRIVLAVVL